MNLWLTKHDSNAYYSNKNGTNLIAFRIILLSYPLFPKNQVMSIKQTAIVIKIADNDVYSYTFLYLIIMISDFTNFSDSHLTL